MSTSPESWPAEAVLRGLTAQGATTARFDADLSTGAVPVPSRLVEQARAAARATGYAQGWVQGQRAAQVSAQAAQDQIAAARRADAAERAAVVNRAVGALIRAADDLGGRVAPIYAETEDLVLRTAVELAETLLGHELSTAPGRDLNALRRAATAAPGTGPLTVRLHPDDCRTLVEVMGTDGEFDGRPVSLRPDTQLQPGDAVACTGATTVDATLAAAVARVKGVFGV